MRITLSLAAALLAAAAPAPANHAITGTWKVDTSTVKPSDKPDRFGVANGVYSCDTCTPAFKVPADGAFHKVAGHDYWDEIRVDASAPDRLRYAYRQGGKLVTESTDTLSPDGKTVTSRFVSTNNAKGTRIEGSTVLTRVGPAPAGGHALSGEWMASKVEGITQDATLLTWDVQGKHVRSTQPTGESYDAVIGGPFVPFKGDRGGAMFQVTAPDDHTLVETQKRNGTLIGVGTFRVAPDGKSLTMDYKDARDGHVSHAVAYKQ